MIYRNITSLCLSYAHAQCRKPKKVYIRSLFSGSCCTFSVYLSLLVYVCRTQILPMYSNDWLIFLLTWGLEVHNEKPVPCSNLCQLSICPQEEEQYELQQVDKRPAGAGQGRGGDQQRGGDTEAQAGLHTHTLSHHCDIVSSPWRSLIPVT